MTCYLHKVYFHLKIKRLVTAKSVYTCDLDPDPDPHWFGSLDLDRNPHRDRRLDPDPYLDPH
jgi:hypothetical protein